MEFKKAVKTKSRLRLAIDGVSGSGKTYTALAIASGMGGTIALIDTEHGSAALYGDRFDFDTLDLTSFQIEDYCEALKAGAEAGYDIVIIDSTSHAWDALLERVERIANVKYGGNTWRAWNDGTPLQRKLIEAMLSYPGHVIVTCRSKTEYSVDKDDKGRTTIKKVGTAAVQRAGFEYEFTMAMSMDVNHVGSVTKDRTGKFQDKFIEKPGKEFGQQLIVWLNEGADPPPQPTITLRQQCIDSWNELKSVMLSTADDGSMLFTNDERIAAQEIMASIKEKSDNEKFAIINDLLNVQKEELHIRYENWCKLNHPEIEIAPEPPKKEDTPPEKPATVTAAPADAKPSGQRSIKDDFNNMVKEKADVPSMFTEPEEETDDFEDDIPGELVTADGELDIF